MVTLLSDYLYRYPSGSLQTRGRCRVRIYSRGNGAHTVLLTELVNDAGESITSACERIATDLVATKDLNPKTTRWIQNDLPHQGGQHPFDELKLVWTSDNTASEPQWQSMDVDQVEALTGDNPDALSRRIGDVESQTEKGTQRDGSDT